MHKNRFTPSWSISVDVAVTVAFVIAVATEIGKLCAYLFVLTLQSSWNRAKSGSLELNAFEDTSLFRYTHTAFLESSHNTNLWIYVSIYVCMCVFPSRRHVSTFLVGIFLSRQLHFSTGISWSRLLFNYFCAIWSFIRKQAVRRNTKKWSNEQRSYSCCFHTATVTGCTAVMRWLRFYCCFCCWPYFCCQPFGDL